MIPARPPTVKASLLLPPDVRGEAEALATLIEDVLRLAVIVDWYNDGAEGAFPSDWGKGVMHMLTDPTVDGTVIRWHVDLGISDAEAAVKDIAHRLGALPCTPSARLVLGLESVG